MGVGGDDGVRIVVQRRSGLSRGRTLEEAERNSYLARTLDYLPENRAKDWQTRMRR